MRPPLAAVVALPTTADSHRGLSTRPAANIAAVTSAATKPAASGCIMHVHTLLQVERDSTSHGAAGSAR
ncbi:hypothetical protein ACCO45_001677 [Purpureocillium lilacinum]|uniref:Uncharacterized protein n=1 Tax=Purpureocillium lilacinum TaxID=33203 RepID=A0ACC4EAW5_PURLI